MFNKLAWMAAFVVATASAHADIMRISMTAPINHTTFPEFPDGQPLGITLDYDTATPGVVYSPTSVGYSNAILSFTLTSGNYTWSASGHFGQVDVLNQHGDPQGEVMVFFVIATGDFPPFFGMPYLGDTVPLQPIESLLGEKPVQSLGVSMGTLASISDSFLDGTSLPTHFGWGIQSALSDVFIGTADNNYAGNQFVEYSAVDLTTTPEPGSLAILLTGGMFLLRRGVLRQN